MIRFNPLYLLLLVPMLLAWYSQSRVRSIYEEYGKKRNRLGYKGEETASLLLSYYGLTDVGIERTPGYLTDHYDPQANILRLSDGVANGDTITSLGIVAHEVGHAAQDADNYRFMRLRAFLAQRVGKITQWSSIAFIGGWIIGIEILMALSGLIMAFMVIFSLVALPVERNASSRALKSLERTGLSDDREQEGVRRVLNAAAFTYLANVAQRMGSFLFFVVMVAAAKGLF